MHGVTMMTVACSSMRLLLHACMARQFVACMDMHACTLVCGGEAKKATCSSLCSKNFSTLHVIIAHCQVRLNKRAISSLVITRSGRKHQRHLWHQPSAVELSKHATVSRWGCYFLHCSIFVSYGICEVHTQRSPDEQGLQAGSVGELRATAGSISVHQCCSQQLTAFSRLLLALTNQERHCNLDQSSLQHVNVQDVLPLGPPLLR